MEIEMSNHLIKTAVEKKKMGQIYHELTGGIVSVYVFLILVIYPFYFQDKYYNIGYAKWKFFLNLTFGTGVILAAGTILYFIYLVWSHELKKNFQNIQISVPDRFVFSYLIVVMISTLCSPYKNQVIWGADGWYMGLIAQLCFVMIYYFVSRYWKWDNTAVAFWLGAAFGVFLLAVIMRFRIDPLKLYQGLEEQYVITFLTTIGQATWYSSYIVLLFPLGMFAFWFYDGRLLRILTGIFTSIGFMTIITQNSDSIFVALGIMIFVLLWFSLESNKRFRRFLEVMMICFMSFKFIGICQLLFPTKAVPLGNIFIFCSQSGLTWALLAGTVIVYAGFCLAEKRRKIDIARIKVVRMIVLFILLTGIGLTVAYIYLNTTGKLPENYRSNSNYLLFNEYWGNNRGLSWMASAKSFVQGNLLRKIAGCGPDGFSLYVQSFFGEELARKWGQSVALTCAHNEWLNVLVNLGIAGAAAYLGIFISSAARFWKKTKKHPELIAIVMAILCYMGHNFFCYQQIVCTPTIFILIGVGESIIRHE